MTDLRHLVGMSMSARKRAARLTAFLSSVPKFRFQRRRMLRMFRRDRLGELLADEYHAARAHYQSKLWYAPFAAAIIYARTRTPDKAEEFLNSLESGANLPDRSPVIAARTLVDAMHGRGGNSARLIIFRKMLRAIAAFCKGEKVVRLHDSDEGLKYFAGFSDLTVSDEENEEAPCEAV